MRSRFVIDPRGSAQVREGFKIALTMNHDIREIDRTVAIAFTTHYRRSQQFDPGNRLIRFPDVGQTTNPADVNLPRIQQAFTFLPGDVVNKLRGYLQPLGKILCTLTADGVSILSHACGDTQSIHSTSIKKRALLYEKGSGIARLWIYQAKNFQLKPYISPKARESLTESV